MDFCTGMLAVGLGAFGAHMFKPIDPTNKDVSMYRLLAMFRDLHLLIMLEVVNARLMYVFGGLKCTYALNAWLWMSGVDDSERLPLGSYGSPSCGPLYKATLRGKP